MLQVAERLQLVRDQAVLNVSKAKAKRLEYANRGSKVRSFDVGDKVWYRIPGLLCKLLEFILFQGIKVRHHRDQLLTE